MQSTVCYCCFRRNACASCLNNFSQEISGVNIYDYSLYSSIEHYSSDFKLTLDKCHKNGTGLVLVQKDWPTIIPQVELLRHRLWECGPIEYLAFM